MSRSPLLRSTLALLAALGLAAVAAPPATAKCVTKWQPDFSGQSGGSLVLDCFSTPSVGGGSGGSKPAKKPRTKPTGAELRALRYTPRASVSRKVQAELVRDLLPSDPVAAADPQSQRARQQIESGDLTRQARSGLRKLKWRTDDLGDHYAQAYIYTWLTVTGTDSLPSKTDRAVRRQLRDRLALDPKVRRMSDARQQAWAERLDSWMVVTVGNYNALRKRGADRGDVIAWQTRTRHIMREDGLLGENVSGGVRLTSKGIVPRK